ncbi:MAG: S41 family peptidase [Tissierellia bacterium]|nr:S41 family peptidase [Tissierellia bacterium]
MKNKRIIWFVIIILLSNALTFIFTTLGLFPGQRTIRVGISEYNELKNIASANEKNIAIKNYVKKNYLYDVTDEQLKDGELHGIVSSLNDPYSSYLSKEEYLRLMEEMEGSFVGVGIYLTGSKDSFITVVSPIDDSPAFKAGIKTGDVILKVDGVEYSSDSMEKAISKIRGEKGTEVTLTIARNTGDENKIFDVTLIREEIKVNTVNYEILEGNLAYIRVSQFDETTEKDFENALKKATEDKAKGIILDLRNNPGGLLNICVNMIDNFFDEGLIVYTENREGVRQETYNAHKGKINLPLILLVNKGSASASEIFAGAIKDNKRGKIIGEQTFGKGIVQTIIPLSEGDGLKLTVTEYFTPSGTSIHGIGVKPDIEITIPEDAEGIGPEFLETDTQLKKAIEILQK